MFKGLANFAGMLRQAQQMGTKLEELNLSLKSQKVTGSAGGGMVTAEVNGLGEVLKITIDPDLVQRGEREMIEDLVPAAVNQALASARQLHTEAVRSLAGGMDVPGLGEALAKFTGGENPGN